MLDFSQVATQISTFTTEQKRALPQREDAQRLAEERLSAAASAWQKTQHKIASNKTSWLLADWFETPDTVYALPDRPLPCAVFAADGSQIVSDRHDPVQLLLLNIGTIAIRYGDDANARMTTCPTLAQPDDDLLEEYAGEQAAIAPRRLAMRRQLAEFDALIALMEERDTAEHDVPTVALSDGTLILWPLETEPERFRLQSLQKLQAQMAAARRQRVPLVGYISESQSRDVVNALRIAACPFEQARCETNCPHHAKPRPHYQAPPCAGTERVRDSDLFAAWLAPGERSAVFGSRSQILQWYAEENRIRFFYLNTGAEIARVEIPAWVAEDRELLERTHTLCYDQAQKGLGYPVALTEAHELAVVREPEKRAFYQLLERNCIRQNMTVLTTQKALSKRARRV